MAHIIWYLVVGLAIVITLECEAKEDVGVVHGIVTACLWPILMAFMIGGHISGK